MREADATVGGVRALAIIDTPQGLEASRKVFPYGYFVEVRPGPVYVGVEKPMKAYSMDYILFTNAKTKDEVVAKIIDTMVKNKPDLVAVAARARRLHAASSSIASTRCPYHPGRAEVLPGQQARSQGLSVSEERVVPDAAQHVSAASEERFIASAEEFAATASRTTVLTANVLQALLVACVVLWVLDVPRQVFNVSFYTEQLLTVCLGLTLALAFVSDDRAAAGEVRLGRGHRVGRDRRLHRLPLPQIG